MNEIYPVELNKHEHNRVRIIRRSHYEKKNIYECVEIKDTSMVPSIRFAFVVANFLLFKS
jgi:hypothetical protein